MTLLQAAQTADAWGQVYAQYGAVAVLIGLYIWERVRFPKLLADSIERAVQPFASRMERVEAETQHLIKSLDRHTTVIYNHHAEEMALWGSPTGVERMANALRAQGHEPPAIGERQSRNLGGSGNAG